VTTIGQIVNRVRGLLMGTLTPEYGLLADAYTVGSGVLRLKNSKTVPPGSTVCVENTTFDVLVSDGQDITVISGVDGSADANYPANSLAVINPMHTTFAIFTEINSVIDELSSPNNGLHAVTTETFDSDPTWNTYPLAQAPLKVLAVRYLEGGTPDIWREATHRLEKNAGVNLVRTAPLPYGSPTVQIDYATPFATAEDLGDTVTSLGMPDRYSTLLAVGAAMPLSLATESRRSQPLSQGDPRRAEEVPITGNVIVFDRMERRFRRLVNTERARLVQQFPYSIPLGQW
jgi:hypothetical protein